MFGQLAQTGEKHHHQFRWWCESSFRLLSKLLFLKDKFLSFPHLKLLSLQSRGWYTLLICCGQSIHTPMNLLYDINGKRNVNTWFMMSTYFAWSNQIAATTDNEIPSRCSNWLQWPSLAQNSRPSVCHSCYCRYCRRCCCSWGMVLANESAFMSKRIPTFKIFHNYSR